jgi:predicted Zn-dependent protease
MNAETIERWRKVVEAQPGNDLARFSYAKALFDALKFDEARAQFESALARKPDWMVVQILLGRCFLATGDKAGARAAFERGLELAVAQHHEGPQAELEQLLADL